MLARTALHPGQPVSTDELAAALWPDGPGTHWQGALRGVVAKVRAFLGALDGPGALEGATATLEGLGGSYAFRSADALVVDVHRASHLTERAHEHLSLGRADRAGEAATEAAGLLDATLLPGVAAEWVDVHRTHIGELRCRALRLAAAASSSLGHHDDAVVAATAAIERDPYDERAHRALLAAHLAAGNRAAGLRAHLRCRRLLVEELGVVPDDRTEALYLELLGAPERGDDVRTVGRPIAGDEHFVGRQHELDVIQALWARCRTDGPHTGGRHTVALHGDAGVGKTQTALQAARLARPENLLYGRCERGAAAPFGPFLDAIGLHLEGLDDADLRVRVSGLEAGVARILPSIADRVCGSADLAGREGSSPSTLATVSALLSRITRTPTVMIIEDVHWADGPTHRMARHLLHELDGHPILVITTYRDEVAPSPEMSRTVAELHHLGRYETMRIPGLSEDDVAALLRTGARAPVTDRDVALIHERTGGNPFFVHQFVAASIESHGDFDPRGLPRTVRELVRYRTTELSRPVQAALTIAALLGPQIPEDVLERTCRSAGIPIEAVDELFERRLLEDHDDEHVRFVHPVVGDAVDDQLSHLRRLRIQRLVSEATAGDDRSRSVRAPFLSSP